jgi:hypothetical protein
MYIRITQQMTKEEIIKALALLPSGKVFHASRHCGVIKLREDPIAFQKRVRDAWQSPSNP